MCLNIVVIMAKLKKILGKPLPSEDKYGQSWRSSRLRKARSIVSTVGECAMAEVYFEKAPAVNISRHTRLRRRV